MTVECQTPGTKLRWSTLGEWISCAHRIDARQASAARCRALEAHASILPRVLIDAEQSVATMEAVLNLLKYGHQSLARPRRGFRERHATTLTIMYLTNRRATLRRLDDEVPPGDNWISVHRDL